MSNKEIIAGVAAGVLLFLMLQGVNILPIVFLLGLIGIVYYVNFGSV
jgi:hypothetical protein